MNVKKETLSQEEVDFIMANTDLSQEKIVEWYSQFNKACPQNKLDKEKFIQFFSMLIPGNDENEYLFCDAIFQACDTDSNGYIDFAEFLLIFCLRSKATLREKLSWLFEVYDTNKSNNITHTELVKMLKLIFSIKKLNIDAYKKGLEIFQLMDRSKDNRITKQEFISGCTKDQSIRDLLTPF
jgi:Ca2+-binding EF-hand superfamily protein